MREPRSDLIPQIQRIISIDLRYSSGCAESDFHSLPSFIASGRLFQGRERFRHRLERENVATIAVPAQAFARTGPRLRPIKHAIDAQLFQQLGKMKGHGELWDRVLPTIAVIDKEDVEVHTLDDVFPELTKGIEQCRPFLKLDTQGFDVEVVKGAQNCIGKMLGLQSELAVRQLYEGAPSYLDALAYYTSLGFTPKDFYTVASDGTDMTALEVDCVMVRQASGKPRTQSMQGLNMQGLKEKTTVAESL